MVVNSDSQQSYLTHKIRNKRGETSLKLTNFKNVLDISMLCINQSVKFKCLTSFFCVSVGRLPFRLNTVPQHPSNPSIGLAFYVTLVFLKVAISLLSHHQMLKSQMFLILCQRGSRNTRKGIVLCEVLTAYTNNSVCGRN